MQPVIGEMREKAIRCSANTQANAAASPITSRYDRDTMITIASDAVEAQLSVTPRPTDVRDSRAEDYYGVLSHVLETGELEVHPRWAI